MSVLKEMIVTREILSKDLFYSTWNAETVWHRMNAFGIIGSPKDSKFPKVTSFGQVERKQIQATGKLIEVFPDFGHAGGTELSVPVIYPLYKKMNFGDAQLLGKEEDPDVMSQKTFINAVSKSTNLWTGPINKQALTHLKTRKELMMNAQHRLKDIFSRWIGFQPYYATYFGYSENLLEDPELSISPQYHPNFYVAGFGKVDYDTDQDTYLSNIATALGTLNNVGSKRFSTKTLNFIRNQAPRHHMLPFEFNGLYGYHVIAPGVALKDLWDDDKWVKANQMRVRSDKNQLITGNLEGYYNGCYVWADDNQFDVKVFGDEGYEAARGVVNFGESNPLEDPIGKSNRRMISAYGQSSLAMGYVQGLDFMDDEWDYGRKKSEAAEMIVGITRATDIDRDGARGTKNALFKERGSLVIAVWADVDSQI